MFDLRSQHRAFRAIGASGVAFMGGLFGATRKRVGLHENSVVGAAFRDIGDVVGRGIGGVFGVMGAGLGGTARVMGAGVGLANSGNYTAWRRSEKARIRDRKKQADLIDDTGILGVEDQRIRDKYGKIRRDPKRGGWRRLGWRTTDSNVGARRFSQRNGWDHFRKGVSNSIFMGPLTPLSLGINTAIAGALSSDDIFDLNDGAAAHFAQGATAEIGAFWGAGVGAGIAAALVPGGMIAAGIGLIAGGIIGGDMGMQLGGLPGKMSKFGAMHGRLAATRKSTFQDSEEAVTMRQRAMQSIHRSQLNARSAFGQEALALHA